MCKKLICTYDECGHQETYAISQCTPKRRGKGYCVGHEADDDPEIDQGLCEACIRKKQHRFSHSIHRRRKNIVEMELEIMDIEWRKDHQKEWYRELCSQARQNSGLQQMSKTFAKEREPQFVQHYSKDIDGRVGSGEMPYENEGFGGRHGREISPIR